MAMAMSEGATLVFVRAVGHVLSPRHGPHGAEIFVQARDLQHVDHCLEPCEVPCDSAGKWEHVQMISDDL